MRPWIIALGLVMGLALLPLGSRAEDPKPSGEVSIDQVQVAFILSGNLGGGKLTYEGKTYDFLNVTLEAAVDMLKNAKKRAAPTPIRELGKHPEDEEPIAIFEGRYGPYVKHKKINATIPKDKEIEKITLEEALQMIEEKAAKKGGKKTAKKKAPAKKKKKAAKKKKTAKSKKAG